MKAGKSSINDKPSTLPEAGLMVNEAIKDVQISTQQAAAFQQRIKLCREEACVAIKGMNLWSGVLNKAPEFLKIALDHHHELLAATKKDIPEPNPNEDQTITKAREFL